MTTRVPELVGVTVDLDDTLYPQSEWLAGAWAAVAAEGGRLGLDPVALHRALLAVAAEGSDRGRIVDRALDEVEGGRPEQVPSLVAAFAAHRPSRLEPYGGAVAALERLAAAVPVVCVTDGMPAVQRAKLVALGIDHLLADVVVSDELGGRAMRKPHPAPFERALAVLGTLVPGGAPRHAVVHVGDRPGKDVAGAAAAGLRCVRVTTGEYAAAAPDGQHAWRTVATFEAAVDLLLGGAERTPRTGRRRLVRAS